MPRKTAIEVEEAEILKAPPDGEIRLSVRIGPERRKIVERLVGQTNQPGVSAFIKALIDQLGNIPHLTDVRHLQSSQKKP